MNSFSDVCFIAKNFDRDSDEENALNNTFVKYCESEYTELPSSSSKLINISGKLKLSSMSDGVLFSCYN
jgi:hypothetical protein